MNSQRQIQKQCCALAVGGCWSPCLGLVRDGPPHEGLHWGLCTPSSLPLCCGSAGGPLALGAAGVVSCPSDWSDSPGQGDQGSRDVSLGDLGVSDYKPAFFLSWKQTGSSEKWVITSSSWRKAHRPNAVVVCIWNSRCCKVSGGPTEDAVIYRELKLGPLQFILLG